MHTAARCRLVSILISVLEDILLLSKKILPSVRVDFVKGWRHSRNDGGMGGIFETREGGFNR